MRIIRTRGRLSPARRSPSSARLSVYTSPRLMPANWTKFWPWIFVAVFGILGNLPAAWRWWRRRSAQSWPLTQGRIEHVNVPSGETKIFGLTLTNSNNRQIKAQITYSYSMNGEPFRGTYSRAFGRAEEAWEFLRDLEGKPVEVHVDSNNAGRSSLSESSLETLLQSRPTAPPSREGEIPSWLRPLLWPVMALALLGLVLSVWVHLQAIAGVMPDSWFLALHVGIFVVFIPAVFVAQRRVGTTNRCDFWKVVLRGAPIWMKYASYGLFGYTLLNFFWAFNKLLTGHSQHAMTPNEWRLFSGHWMVFYFTSFAILYASIANQPWDPNRNIIVPAGEHCANGHLIAKGEGFCAVCGGPRAY